MSAPRPKGVAARKPRWKTLRVSPPSPDAIREEFGFGQPPVVVDRILRSIGVNIHDDLQDGISGKLVLTESDASIWLSKNDNRETRRFTLAYLFAHLLLHPPGEYVASGKRESEALAYAKDLMMPEPLLEEAARASPAPLHLVFGVPKQIMDDRLVELGLNPTDPGAAEDRREYERVPARIEVRFLQSGEAARALRAYSVDVSAGGLCLRTRRKYELGESLKLGMTVENEHFSLQGVVAWIKRGTIGVRFQSVSSEDRKRLGRIVAQLGSTGRVDV